MYLHIVDDASQLNQFIERTNEMFPEQHLFYVLTKKGKTEIIVKKKNVIPIIPSNRNIASIAKELPSYKAIFIHNLCYYKSKIILKSDASNRFIWFVWGFDYYNTYPRFFSKLFLKYTKFINIILFKYSLSVKALVFRVHPATKYFGLISKDRIKQNAAKRFVSTVNNMPNHSALFNVVNIPVENRFNGIYYSIESITKGSGEQNIVLGDNIFIGNSASNTSNHIDLFLKLKSIGVNNRELIVPLSYGCSRYRLVVKWLGTIIFKEKFKPLLNILPLEIYNRQVNSCNVMIFNHKRAQAIGNIIMGIWSGHKVFLRKSNPVYSYLKSLGIEVFSIENELLLTNLNELEKERKRINREIIIKQYGELQIRENYLQLIERIENEIKK
jgi:hypothetical protein